MVTFCKILAEKIFSKQSLRYRFRLRIPGVSTTIGAAMCPSVAVFAIVFALQQACFASGIQPGAHGPVKFKNRGRLQLLPILLSANSIATFIDIYC